MDQERKKTLWKKAGIIAGSVVGFLLVLAGIIWLSYHLILDYYIGKMKIVTTEEELIFVTEPLIDTYLPEGVTTEDLPVITVPSTETKEPVSPETAPAPPSPPAAPVLPLICDTDEVKNILLIGVDAKANQAGRSDTMILLTINERTKKIVLTSLMRDILAQYPDGKWDKLNHAHAYGGPALLLKVLKSSFNLQVDHYIKVNLDSFITVVDAMGGVDLTLKDDEVSYINRFIAKDLPLGQGKYHLTGSQVIWHVRNRSSAGSDHDRTSRQRTTIAAMMKKMGGLSLGELNSLLNVCLPLVTTNLPAAEWKNLVNEALTYAKFQVVSTALPRQGMYYSGLYKGMWAMRLDFEKNCRYLYETVYGTPAP